MSHVIPRIKEYIYKVYDSSGDYLGNLPNVDSDFQYSLDINTSGTTMQMEVATSPDTTGLAVLNLTDESGNQLTDESSNALITDGQPPIISMGDGPTALIQNGNRIKVFEYGFFNPDGKCVFQGEIQRWEAGFGGDSNSGGATTNSNGGDVITVLVYSDGNDLSNYMVTGSTTLDGFQNAENATYAVPASYNLLGQEVVPYPTLTNITQVSVMLAGASAAGGVVQVALYASSATGISNLSRMLSASTPDATASQMVTSTSPQVYDFYFDYSFPGVAPNFYVFSVILLSGAATNIYYSSTASGAVGPTGGLYFQTFYFGASTIAVYPNLDPGLILQSVLGNSYAGLLSWNSGTIATVGFDVTYEFNTNTVLEAIQAVLSLAPENYYWYTDLGTDTLYLNKASSVADINLIKGYHLDQVTIIASIENIANYAFFSGGIPLNATTNVFVSAKDATSISRFGQKLTRLSDSNVTDTTTALVVAQNGVQEDKNEQNQTSVTIIDGTIDTTSIHVGQMVSFSGFGLFVDGLLLQIVRIDYAPSEVTLTLGVLPKRTPRTVQRIISAISAQQSLDNPSTPNQ